MRATPRLFLTVGIILLVVTPLAGCASSITTATSSTSVSYTPRGHIIFARAGDQYWDETIFFANADGTHQRRLTQPGTNCCPRISRDGKWILFAAPAPNDRITTAIMRPDGTGYKAFPLPDKTINVGPGAWSPDGKQIAFEVWDLHNHARDGIYIGRSVGGGTIRRITTTHGVPGDFSPDGKRLAFFRETSTMQNVGSVWVVNVNGTGLKELTPPTFLAGLGTVRWSPDGQRIMLQTARKQSESALWTVRPDGSHFTKLFKDRKGRFAISSTWSPDGTHIMFALDPIADEFSHPPNGMYVITADGTGLTRVIGGQNFKREPDWVR